MKISHPTSDEYFSYYGTYVSLVTESDILKLLDEQQRELQRMLSDVGDDAARKRPAPSEWSVNEVIGHLSDTERIFAYRLLRIARGDTTPLPGFDQDPYVETGKFNARTLRDVMDEFSLVRASTIFLVRNLDAESLARRGVASDHPVSARALVYIIAGHERHHMNSLRDVYLK
jgi:uncharacterized damage-inducible protein DinB